MLLSLKRRIMERFKILKNLVIDIGMTLLIILLKLGTILYTYFQQKYVYIHKIENILKPTERPSDMDWDSDRNILCLGKRLYECTWEEWINNVGFRAPYTPTYRCTQTSSWSYDILRNHNKYKDFNIIRLDRILKKENWIQF